MLPAARVTDMHTCPMWTGVVPHIGGPTLPPGAITVLIGGLPAARVTDQLTCVGPPDMIASGAPTVLIKGLPAARMTDLTAHGGVIVLGCPTVLIGGPAAAPPPDPPPPPKGLNPDEVKFMQQGGKTEKDLAEFREQEEQEEQQKNQGSS